MKTKLLALLAIASVGFAGAATAQTLGKSYIGAGYGEAKLDPKHGPNAYADAYLFEINLPVIANDDSGIDFGIEASRIDIPGAKSTTFLLTGAYYISVGETFRPFVELGAGMVRATESENHPVYSVRVGGEFLPVENLSIKGTIFFNDGEELEHSWGVGLDATYWIIEQVGVFGLYQFEDFDQGEAHLYGAGVRVSF